jgi:aspartate kinase
VFEVRSTFSQARGTRVHQEVRHMENVVVSGIAFDRKQAKISIVDIPDRPGVAARIFGALGKAGINVDMIIQSEAIDRKNDISFTVSEGELKKALKALRPVKAALEAKDLVAHANVGKVAVVGVGMRSHSGVASKMFQALADAKINIQMISTSEIKISCVITRDHVDEAVKVLHKAFELDKK